MTARTRFFLASIGTRGDIQPFVALATALKASGHSVSLAAPDDFQAMAAGYGIDFVPLGIAVRSLLTSAGFEGAMTRNALAHAPALLSEGLRIIDVATRAAWPAAQGADVLVLNMNTFFGIDFAEKLNIPAVMIAPQPLVPTREYPLCIFGGGFGGVLNKLSYGLMEVQQAYYNLNRNRLRREVLGLGRVRDGRFFRAATGDRLPVLHCFSPSLVPPPADWPDNAFVTGFFELPERVAWTPPDDLRAFLDRGEAPLYIGFGSMPFGGARNTEMILSAIEMWGGRVVLGRGWGGIDPQRLPDTVHLIDDVPHPLLFPLMRAVVHHGGAGTTAAGLRAGRPTFVAPQTVDQPFWAARVHALGCGPEPVPLKKLTSERLAAALADLTSNAAYAVSAADLAKKLAAEGGTARAIEAIDLILRRAGRPGLQRADETISPPR